LSVKDAGVPSNLKSDTGHGTQKPVEAAVSAEIENGDAKTTVLMMRPAGLLLRTVGLPP
jgi:hypothetical protein